MSLTSSLVGCGDKPLQTLETSNQGTYSGSLSPSGQFALVGSIHHGGSLWRIEDAERLYNWNHSADQYSSIVQSTFSTDSKFALTAEKKRFVLWDVASGRPGGFWPAENGVLAMALSDQGRFALIASEDNNLRYIDLATQTLLTTMSHAETINGVAISGDGKLGASGGDDGLLKVWDLRAGKAVFAYQMGGEISALDLSRDGSLVFASRFFGKGHVWRVRNGNMVTTIGHNRTTITSARFSQDNKKLLTGFTARRMILWDTNTGDRLQNWRADAPLFWRPTGLIVMDVGFTKHENQYLTMFSDGTLYRW